FRCGLDDLVAAWLANAARLDAMAEVERGRCAAAEAHDVDVPLALVPRLAQRLVGFVDARQLAETEDAAKCTADGFEARADPRDVEIEVRPLRVPVVSGIE